jgi:S-adenosylmethionine:tRNA ribosyltransferase-isomerase
MHPKDVSISEYTYSLPEERIALFPIEKRDQSKLLHYREGEILHHFFYELPDLIHDKSLLVFNNTRVVQARLLFLKATGTTIEIMCLEPVKPYQIFEMAFHVKQACVWRCMVGNAKRWKNETLSKTIENNQTSITLNAELLERDGDQFLVRFSWSPADLMFAEVLSLAGVMPLPPYLNREATEADLQRYQTVYAANDGSVAAPTAGLHFTPEVLEALTAKGHQTDYITLHVGAGTFKPVKSETMEGHDMHRERFQVSKQVLEDLLSDNFKHTIAVGTTSMRTLESVYWCGVQLLNGKPFSLHEAHVNQWEPYESEQHYSVKESIEALLRQMDSQQTDTLSGETGLLIAPGYRFKLVDGIITNFHQPGSTLLLLIAAFTGEDWKKVYSSALEHNYRFLSYGDSSLLWRNAL